MSQRIDKYLWCIRIYKTRSQSTTACKGGKVKVNGQSIKPSYEVKQGDKIEVRYYSIHKTFIVKQFPGSRVSAKLVNDYAEDTTPSAEMEKLKTARMNQGVFRDKGSGRPTKKDRRAIDKAKGWDY